MSEVLNSTLPQEHLDQINHWIPLLVSLMSNGTHKEIAKGLESQFVDRSTEHLYRKVTPTDQSESTEVYKYVKGEIESAFIPTRRDMKLSFPPTCYSSNDPITLLYESNYKLIQYWTLSLCLLRIIYCTLENPETARYEAVSVSFFRCSFSALIRFLTSSIIASSSFSHSSRVLAYTV